MQIGTHREYRDVNFPEKPGEGVCIVAESGSGKTTLMRLILGLDTPTVGHIQVDGANVDAMPPAILQMYRTRVGTIFQEPLLLSGMTLAENLAYPLELRGMDKATVGSKTTAMLSQLGLGLKGSALSDSLTISERMMATIGRALIGDPMIVLADEPLALLDSAQRRIATELLTAAHSRGASVMVFAQDSDIAKPLGASIMQLKNGTVEQSSLSAVTYVPKDEPVAEATAQVVDTAQEQEEEVPVVTRKKESATKHAPAKHKGKKTIKITPIGS
jgi:ABC-type methionine transport system ATPase subunit